MFGLKKTSKSLRERVKKREILIINRVYIVMHSVECEFQEIVDVYRNSKKANDRVKEEKLKNKITLRSNEDYWVDERNIIE